MPKIVGDEIPETDKVWIILLLTVAAVAAVILMPNTETPAPVEERVLILLVFIFTSKEGLELAIAVTVPPAPVEDKPVMVLLRTDKVVAIPVEPKLIPVIAACPVMVLMVLLETEDVPPKPFGFITVIADVPPVQLLKVLPVMVFVAGPKSVLCQPAMVVAPVTVMFEKLLLLLLIVAPIIELAVVLYNVTVPPAPALLKAVITELEFIFCIPVDERPTLLLIKVTLPVVFTFKLVKVLLLMF